MGWASGFESETPDPTNRVWSVTASPSLLERLRKHATDVGMLNMRNLAGVVVVDGLKYEWELQREPQWSDFDGWRGMTVSLLQQDTQRGAVLEFPPPKRLLKGLQRGRLQINEAIIVRGVRAALLAGWEPTSRGKPMVFEVDAEGN